MLNCPRCGRQIVSREPLTKKQVAIYGYLFGYAAQHGYAPTLQEVANRFHLKSLASINEHLKNLEDKGYIRREFNLVRAITCLVHPDELGAVPMQPGRVELGVRG